MAQRRVVEDIVLELVKVFGVIRWRRRSREQRDVIFGAYQEQMSDDVGSGELNVT